MDPKYARHIHRRPASLNSRQPNAFRWPERQVGAGRPAGIPRGGDKDGKWLSFKIVVPWAPETQQRKSPPDLPEKSLRNPPVGESVKLVAIRYFSDAPEWHSAE